jgi:sortase A
MLRGRTYRGDIRVFMIVKAINGGSLAVGVLLVVVAFALLYGCGQASSPVEGEEERGGVEQATQGDGEEVGGKGNGEPNRERSNITPPKDKTLRLTVPKMKRIKYDEIPTGLGTDERLFHDYAGVHIENTGWPWEEEANVYIAGQRLGFPKTNSYLAFWDLNKLEKGDEIYVTDSEGRWYTYVVNKKWVGKGSSCGALTSNTLSELKPVEGKNIVTLQTCTLPDFKNRLLVRGELKDVSEG